MEARRRKFPFRKNDAIHRKNRENRFAKRDSLSIICCSSSSLSLSLSLCSLILLRKSVKGKQQEVSHSRAHILYMADHSPVAWCKIKFVPSLTLKVLFVSSLAACALSVCVYLNLWRKKFTLFLSLLHFYMHTRRKMSSERQTIFALLLCTYDCFWQSQKWEGVKLQKENYVISDMWLLGCHFVVHKAEESEMW
jgi:hypothetical protein